MPQQRMFEYVAQDFTVKFYSDDAYKYHCVCGSILRDRGGIKRHVGGSTTPSGIRAPCSKLIKVLTEKHLKRDRVVTEHYMSERNNLDQLENDSNNQQSEKAALRYILPATEAPHTRKLITSSYYSKSPSAEAQQSQSNLHAHVDPDVDLSSEPDTIDQPHYSNIPTEDIDEIGDSSTTHSIPKGKQITEPSESTRVFNRTSTLDNNEISNRTVMAAMRQLDEKVNELNFKVGQLLESHRRLIYLNTLDFNARQSKFGRDPNYDYDYDYEM